MLTQLLALDAPEAPVNHTWIHTQRKKQKHIYALLLQKNSS